MVLFFPIEQLFLKVVHTSAEFIVWLLHLSEVPQFCPRCGHVAPRRSDRRSCLFSGRALSVSSPANRSMGIVLEVGHSKSAIANGEA